MTILIRFAMMLAALLALSFPALAQDTAGPDLVALDDTVPPPVELIDPTPEIVSTVCPFKSEIDYEPGRVKCGFIAVPENREDPDSRTIRLNFAHIVAEGRLNDDEDEPGEDAPQVRDDPIAYLTGGPGAAISFYIERFLEHDITQTRDLYILNQRGIGDSDELCPFYNDTRRELVRAQTTEAGERERAARMLACFEAAAARGVDLRGYNTVENARDVRALRRALGLDDWNVWGISYGSHLGQMLATLDPEGIRALVLDAIVPNDIGGLMEQYRWVERDFDLIFAECERQGAAVCDGLEARLSSVFETLMEDPINLTAIDEEFYPSGTVHIPAAAVALPAFSMMYEQDQHAAIPAVIRALTDIFEARDPDVLDAFQAAGGNGVGISLGMSMAIRCNDGYTHAQADVAERDIAAHPRFAGGIYTVEGSRAAARACDDAGLFPRDRDDYALVETDIPTLIVNGDWDPVTPPALAERIAPGFSNGRLIVVPYAGHGPTRSMAECGTQVMTDFFDDPAQDLDALDASCLEEGVEPPEFVSYLQTTATLRAAALATKDEKRLLAPVMIVGLLLAMLLGGLIAILFGMIARATRPDGSVLRTAGPLQPRLIALATAAASLLGMTLLGVGAAATAEISEISFLAGLAPPARLGSALVMLAGALGLLTIVMSFRTETRLPLRLRTRFGLPVVGLAAVALALYLVYWDLAPW